VTVDGSSMGMYLAQPETNSPVSGSDVARQFQAFLL